MRFGLSYHEGTVDAGLTMEGDLRTPSAGKFIGGGRVEGAYDTGDFDTQRGSANLRSEIGLGNYGASLSVDAKTREFSGVSVGVGRQIGVSTGVTNTNTISVRQFWREVVAPTIDKVRSWLPEKKLP